MKIKSGYTEIFEGSEQKGVYLLSFRAKGDICTPMKVKITLNDGKATDMDYFVPVQTTRFALVFDDGIPESAVFEPTSEIELWDVILEKQEDAPETVCLKTGMFLEEGFEKVTLSENDSAGTGPCCDMVLHDGVLYTIGGGKLTAVDVRDIDRPVILSSLEIDAPLRQIALHPDKNHVIITCRQNGMYIIDVQNPKNMLLRTKYDTIELATGIVTEGSYAFVSCRQFGVEIIDISDVNNPRHVSIARCGEAQSCKIHNGILYAGVWGGLRVDIIDVKNPAKPVYLSSARLNGKGDGLCVHTFDGRTYLYAATGQHSQNVPVETAFNDPRYGQGNGLDIFDVTDPTKPIWQSTTKIDGRFYCPANDYWEAEISKTPDGRIYAYVTNTYNGIYIFDVTDPCAVKRLESIDIFIPKTSRLFKEWSHPTRDVIFPYNQHEYSKDVIGAVICLDGYMLIAGVTTGLHIYKNASVIFKNLEAKYDGFEEVGSFYDTQPKEITAHYKNGGQIYGVCRHGDKVFAACGQKGIACLDASDLSEKYTVAVKDVCMDCVIYENTLFCAEGTGGVGIYEITQSGLTEKDRYIYEGTVKSVRLSPKAKYMCIQCDSSLCKVIRLKGKECVHTVKSGGIMYFKNLCNSLAGGRYMGVYGHSSFTFWFDFGKEDELDTPILLSNGDSNMTFQTSIISMQGGQEAFGEYVLAVSDGGKYCLYKPAFPLLPFNRMSNLEMKTANTYFNGKPAIYGDKIVITDRIEGKIYIGNISADGQITISRSLSVNGNPDISLICDDGIFIPLGYEGLGKINL